MSAGCHIWHLCGLWGSGDLALLLVLSAIVTEPSLQSHPILLQVLGYVCAALKIYVSLNESIFLNELFKTFSV